MNTFIQTQFPVNSIIVASITNTDLINEVSGVHGVYPLDVYVEQIPDQTITMKILSPHVMAQKKMTEWLYSGKSAQELQNNKEILLPHGPQIPESDIEKSYLDYRFWEHPSEIAGFRKDNWYILPRCVLAELAQSLSEGISGVDPFVTRLSHFAELAADFMLQGMNATEDRNLEGQAWIFYVSILDLTDLFWDQLKKFAVHTQALGATQQLVVFAQTVTAAATMLLLDYNEPQKTYSKVFEKIDDLARILYSREFSEKGILAARGLTLWRMNLVDHLITCWPEQAAHYKLDSVFSHRLLATSWMTVRPFNAAAALEHWLKALSLGLKKSTALIRDLFLLCRNNYLTVIRPSDASFMKAVEMYLSEYPVENPESILEAVFLSFMAQSLRYRERYESCKYLMAQLAHYSKIFTAGFRPIPDYDEIDKQDWQSHSQAILFLIRKLPYMADIPNFHLGLRWLKIWVYDYLNLDEERNSELILLFMDTTKNYNSDGLGHFFEDEIFHWPPQFDSVLAEELANLYRLIANNDQTRKEHYLDKLEDRLFSVWRDWAPSRRASFNRALKDATLKFKYVSDFQEWFQKTTDAPKQ